MMGRMIHELCDACRLGYHSPFNRFQKVAVHEQGPTFLSKCERCGTLWHETLHDARVVRSEEAMSLYPNITLP